MSHFYNTINETGQTLMQFEAQAKTQDDMVLEVFKLQNQPLAWWEVWAFLKDMHEGSCKRAITNLFNEGHLIKTD